MNLDTIVNIPGDLRTAYTQAVPGTLRHVDELMNERRTKPTTLQGDNLRNQSFYTADGELYFVDGETPKLAMTREAENLVLRHIDDAVAQLTAGGNYRPDPAEAATVIKAKDTEIFDLTKLSFKKHDAEFSYLEVSTTRYDKLNPEQRRLAQRVYGKGEDFVANMAMLRDAGIGTTNVHVLTPEYVKEHANRSPIGRASWLSSFSSSSGFLANDRSIYNGGCLRGVRREVVVVPQIPAGNAPENAVPSAPSEITPARCYETLLADPGAAIQAMDDKVADGLSRLVADYLATKKQ